MREKNHKIDLPAHQPSKKRRKSASSGQDKSNSFNSKFQDRPYAQLFEESKLWKVIFSLSSPVDLHKWQRVSKSFQILLSEEETWEAVRICQFGTAPAPLQGMTEKRFMRLLAGRGCDTCKNVRVERPQWAFARRLCDGCLNRQLIRVCH